MSMEKSLKNACFKCDQMHRESQTLEENNTLEMKKTLIRRTRKQI
jgi:hypothetical protein